MFPALLLIATNATATPTTNAPVLDDAIPLAAFLSEDAPKPVMDKWTGSIAIGATYQDGNTDSRAVNANALAEYRREHDRWTLSGYWNYGETKDQGTGDYNLDVRKAGAGLKYDYFLSEKLYLFANVGMETDALADLQRRSFAGAGAGYQWREDEKLKWGSELGAGYFIEERYVSDDSEYVAARIANNIDWTINEKSNLIHILALYPSLEDKEDVFGRSDLRFKTSLTEAMFAQIQWVWDYDNTPSEGKDRTDNTITLGVGWSF